jgi:hypothetical protein
MRCVGSAWRSKDLHDFVYITPKTPICKMQMQIGRCKAWDRRRLWRHDVQGNDKYIHTNISSTLCNIPTDTSNGKCWMQAALQTAMQTVKHKSWIMGEWDYYGAGWLENKQQIWIRNPSLLSSLGSGGGLILNLYALALGQVYLQVRTSAQMPKPECKDTPYYLLVYNICTMDVILMYSVPVRTRSRSNIQHPTGIKNCNWPDILKFCISLQWKTDTLRLRKVLTPVIIIHLCL